MAMPTWFLVLATVLVVLGILVLAGVDINVN